MPTDAPVRMISKIERTTAKIGTVSPGKANYPAGCKFYMGYQKGSGSNKHSGPNGKRQTRFYQARFRSLAGKRVSK